MSEHSQETKIAILEEKVDHMMGHVKELTLRVRANEKVVASVSLLGVIACTFVGAGYFAPKAEACSPPLDGSPANCGPGDRIIYHKDKEPDYVTKEPERQPTEGQQDARERMRERESERRESSRDRATRQEYQKDVEQSGYSRV